MFQGRDRILIIGRRTYEAHDTFNHFASSKSRKTQNAQELLQEILIYEYNYNEIELKIV